MSNAGEKTEKATPRRRQKAREEGQVSKSSDLNAAVVLTVAFILFLLAGGHMVTSLKLILVDNLTHLNISEITLDGFPTMIMKYIFKGLLIVAPILIGLVVGGIAINLAQVGILFSAKAIKPSLNKINPKNGFKKIFSMKGIVELLKGLFKVGSIGIIGYTSIYPHRTQLMMLSNTELITSKGNTLLATSLSVILGIIFSITWKVCLFLLLLGILDYIYQKYEHEKSIKMTKQEIKDEFKNIEGNPEIKRKIKSTQMQMAQNRMMKNVPEADVVVTNPTHYAVAIKYDTKKAPAPYVVAKGVDLVAKRIKDKAKEHKVPIVENKPLARSLYKLVDLNKIVPEELFVAVAEVLAYVYKKNGKKKRT